MPDFKQWLNDEGINAEELSAVTIPGPTKRKLVAWASENGLSGYQELLDAIFMRVKERRESSLTQDTSTPEPEFLDGIPKVE